MLFFSTIYGQTTHYLFIQTENNQPFYLRLMGATLSSNATGYLLVPKLTDGEYELYIGFAQTDKEQHFTVKLEGKDLGFSLKQELNNNWSLFNLVDFSLIQGQMVAAQPKEEKKEPEVVEKPAPAKELPKEPELKTEPDKIPESTEKPKTRLPEVKKIYDRASADGIDMVFVVSGPTKNDTVILYVPVLKPKGEAQKRAVPEKKSVADQLLAVVLRENQWIFTRPLLL